MAGPPEPRAVFSVIKPDHFSGGSNLTDRLDESYQNRSPSLTDALVSVTRYLHHANVSTAVGSITVNIAGDSLNEGAEFTPPTLPQAQVLAGSTGASLSGFDTAVGSIEDAIAALAEKILVAHRACVFDYLVEDSALPGTIAESGTIPDTPVTTGSGVATGILSADGLKGAAASLLYNLEILRYALSEVYDATLDYPMNKGTIATKEILDARPLLTVPGVSQLLDSGGTGSGVTGASGDGVSKADVDAFLADIRDIITTLAYNLGSVASEEVYLMVRYKR